MVFCLDFIDVFGAVWPFTIILPETYKPVILTKIARKRGLQVDAPKLNVAFLKKSLDTIYFFQLN